MKEKKKNELNGKKGTKKKSSSNANSHSSTIITVTIWTHKVGLKIQPLEKPISES